MTHAAIWLHRYRTFKVEILLMGMSVKEITAGACKAGKGDMLKTFNIFVGCLYTHESKSAKTTASVKVISANY